MFWRSIHFIITGYLTFISLSPWEDSDAMTASFANFSINQFISMKSRSTCNILTCIFAQSAFCQQNGQIPQKGVQKWHWSNFLILYQTKKKKKMNDGIKVLHGLKGICESCREMDFWLAVECSRNEHQEELESRISSGLWFGAQHYSEDQLSSFFHWVRAKWRKLGSKSNKKSWRLIYTCSRVTLGNPEGCASTVVESILGCATLLLKSSDDRVTAIPWFCDSVE